MSTRQPTTRLRNGKLVSYYFEYISDEKDQIPGIDAPTPASERQAQINTRWRAQTNNALEPIRHNRYKPHVDKQSGLLVETQTHARKPKKWRKNERSETRQLRRDIKAQRAKLRRLRRDDPEIPF